jgi:fluoroquinolone transport system ATP-binding protein
MIQIEDLVFEYPKSKAPVLRALNFKIDKGEIFGFLGPSGAGKSTTQKILYKSLKGYGGSVVIDQKNIKDWDNSYFEKIGVGFELPNHYLKLTGKENMNLFASFYKKDSNRNINKLFEMVGLQEDMDKPVSAYSKGMKVRLNFIRAIQHNPDILFFDEPTSGLDPINAHIIKQHILDLKSQGKTVFITTHTMEIADQLCDRVAFIVDGELQATDRPKNLKKKYGKDAVNVELMSGANKEFPIIGLGNSLEFLAFIKQDEIRRIQTLEATLEEVFIKITGKKLSI